MIEVGPLPSLQVMLSCKYQRYYEPIRLPACTSTETSVGTLYPVLLTEQWKL